MQPHQDFDKGLSAIEMDFFASGAPDDADASEPNVPAGPKPRAHLSRHLKWVVLVVVGALVLLGVAAQERLHGGEEAMQPSAGDAPVVGRL
jgi:hypothetical protein